eukprot:TRINITY_DN13502_c0_g1_i2.p1 TRINITY_DN13502_c0_g1~~TRINITY_DN13502_c0_g1_i2.p1  ORF type:complete len:331 (+),score=61.27 TRINITY_DN13502_c0_g1_i2:98-1090(+)
MPPTVDSVQAATSTLKGRIERTPLLESKRLNSIIKGRLVIKAECLQTAGSFKIRGAMNRVARLPEEEKKRGVIAFSSGNFGKGLSAACKELNVPCTIVIPEDAPKYKIDACLGYGSQVLLSPVVKGQNREVTAAKLAKDTSASEGLTLLHPFEDFDVIAGQGTAAVEIINQLRDEGISLSDINYLLIPAGGGGLAAGCNLVFEDKCPNTSVYVVEPKGYSDHCESLEVGRRVPVKLPAPPTICDALQAASPGVNTFPINKRCAGGLVVSDAGARLGQQVARTHFGLYLEPSGAIALAAALSGELCLEGKVTIVIASGGSQFATPLREAKL